MAREASERVKTRRPSKAIATLILSIFHDAKRPLGAHEVAAIAERQGKSLTPAQAYRTMRRFIRAGLVLRVESRNAFILKGERSPLVLLCDQCRAVEEIDDGGAGEQLFSIASQLPFRPEGVVLEIAGRCRNCST